MNAYATKPQVPLEESYFRCHETAWAAFSEAIVNAAGIADIFSTIFMTFFGTYYHCYYANLN